MKDNLHYKFIIVVLVLLCLTIAVTFTITLISIITGEPKKIDVTEPVSIIKPAKKRINKFDDSDDDSYVENNELVLKNLYYILGYQDGLLDVKINPNAVNNGEILETDRNPKVKVPTTTPKPISVTEYHKRRHHHYNKNHNVLVNEYTINLDDPKIKDKNYGVYFGYNISKNPITFNRNSFHSELPTPICSLQKLTESPETATDIYNNNYRIARGWQNGVKMEQEVNVEKCTFLNTSLLEEVEKMTGFEVICTQLYSHVPLLAIDHNNKTMESHFKISCCCQCKILIP